MPSSQRTPGAAPQVGQRIASICLGVISFMVEQDSADKSRGLFNLDHIWPKKGSPRAIDDPDFAYRRCTFLTLKSRMSPSGESCIPTPPGGNECNRLIVQFRPDCP